MLAELIDAVVGVDTHHDTHEVELALPTGTPIGTRKISNDNSGFAELLAWILEAFAGTAGGRLDRGHPQLRCRVGPRGRCRRPDCHRVRAAQPQGPPREG